MSTSVATLDELLARLEADWIEPDAAGPDEIQAMLGRRQEVLDAIQSLDAAGLSEPDREQLQARLAAVHARDQQLLTALREHMNLLAKQLGNMAQSRAAVRGYRAAEDSEARIFIRPA